MTVTRPHTTVAALFAATVVWRQPAGLGEQHASSFVPLAGMVRYRGVTSAWNELVGSLGRRGLGLASCLVDQVDHHGGLRDRDRVRASRNLDRAP